MAQTSYPFDSTDTTESQFSQMFRRIQSNGVWGSPSDTAVKVTGDSTGMQVKVAAGYGMVRGHFYSNDAQVTLAISAATTSPRIDLVVLKLDPTANNITLAVVAGTPAGTPADPSLTQTDTGVYELPIARVSIAANATTIAAGNVADIRPFMGKQFAIWTTATRPASPSVAENGLNTTTGVPEFWSGSAWLPFLPAITSSMITAVEQASIAAGKLRAGGTSAGTPTTMFIQSGTPTANAVGDLWFW
jgi:hypothetical protein